MSDAATILKMIEEVSPDDTAKLDEIDARVWCFLRDHTFVKMHGLRHVCYLSKSSMAGENFVHTDPMGCTYTRSRDALKAIRPEGWVIDILGIADSKTQAFIFAEGTSPIKGCIKTPSDPFLPTEELAELHAIIQAIEHERGVNA